MRAYGPQVTDVPAAYRNLALCLCLLLGTGHAATPPAATVPADADASMEVQNVADGIVLLQGRFVEGAQPDGNSVVVDAPDGLIVIDSGRHAAHTQRLLDYAASVERPIAAIVNTHWHLDHVAGNPLLRHAYPRARVYATPAIEAAMKGFLADYRKQLQGMLAQRPEDAQAAQWCEEIARIDAGDRLFPTDPVTSAGTRTIAGRALLLGVTTNAVTQSDLWLLDQASGTLIAGDLVTLPAPLLDTACPQRWSQVLEQLVGLDFQRVVPGHGPVLTRAQFLAYRHGYDNLLACAADGSGEQVCIAQWLQDAASLVPADQQALARTALQYYLKTALDPARPASPSCSA